jgi:Flp pilus assembly protein TadD
MDLLGVACLQTHQVDQAETLFLRAIQKIPYNASPYLHLGQAFQEQGEYDAADLYYAQAAVLNDESPKAPFHRALLAIRRNRPDEAVLYYQETLKINPNHAAAYNGIGAVRARQHRWDEAETAFRRAVTLDPADKIAQDNLQHLLQERAQPSSSHP